MELSRRFRSYNHTWIILTAVILINYARISNGNQFDEILDEEELDMIKSGWMEEPGRFHSRARRSSKATIVPPWIRPLTDAEKKSIKSGWLSNNQTCDPIKDAHERDYFLTNPNTTQTVEHLLKTKNKAGICDFLGKYLLCSRTLKTCRCRLGATFIESAGECQFLEGAFDCGNNYYDKKFIDNPKLDNRAGLFGSVNCVAGTKCVDYPELRANNSDNTTEIFVCKPDTPGHFPELRRISMYLMTKIVHQFPWINRGDACKIHLNTHSDVTNHTEAKEQVFQEFSASARHASKKCNALKNEECHRVAKVCVCAKGFVLQGGQCRLSGSITLFEDHVRKCEYKIWPTFIVSEVLLKREKYKPDSLPVTCVKNANCTPNAVCANNKNSPDCFNTCQCEPGKVCDIPKPYKLNNTAMVQAFPSIFLHLHLLIPVMVFQ